MLADHVDKFYVSGVSLHVQLRGQQRVPDVTGRDRAVVYIANSLQDPISHWFSPRLFSRTFFAANFYRRTSQTRRLIIRLEWRRRWLATPTHFPRIRLFPLLAPLPLPLGKYVRAVWQMMIQPLLRRICYSQLKKQASLNVTIWLQPIIFFSYCALSDKKCAIWRRWICNFKGIK